MRDEISAMNGAIVVVPQSEVRGRAVRAMNRGVVIVYKDEEGIASIQAALGRALRENEVVA